MNSELKIAFITHLCKYLGIALVSGSIVHAGTLGGNSVQYIILILFGIALTVVGNYLENKMMHKVIDTRFVALAIALSFGTGMLSGGIQHYLDNPSFGAILLSSGFMLTFASLAFKDFKSVVTKRALLLVFLLCVAIYFSLSAAIPQVLFTFLDVETITDTHH